MTYILNFLLQFIFDYKTFIINIFNKTTINKTITTTINLIKNINKILTYSLIISSINYSIYAIIKHPLYTFSSSLLKINNIKQYFTSKNNLDITLYNIITLITGLLSFLLLIHTNNPIITTIKSIYIYVIYLSISVFIYFIITTLIKTKSLFTIPFYIIAISSLLISLQTPKLIILIINIINNFLTYGKSLKETNHTKQHDIKTSNFIYFTFSVIGLIKLLLS